MTAKKNALVAGGRSKGTIKRGRKVGDYGIFIRSAVSTWDRVKMCRKCMTLRDFASCKSVTKGSNTVISEDN